MKEWIKHKYGFINIDSNNVYLTKTGNWSEIHNLQEKNYKSTKELIEKIGLKNKVLNILYIGLILFGLISSIINLNIFNLSILFISILFYFFRFKREENYLIPNNKILKIINNQDEIDLEFLDSNNKNTIIKLKKINQKGIDLFKEIDCYNLRSKK